MLTFVFRLVGYALLLGVASRIMQVLWVANGLDTQPQLEPLHDTLITALLFSPIAFALIGFGALRDACVFLGCCLAAAAITAPFALARVVGV